MFKDRNYAGIELAKKFLDNYSNPLVCAIPRGGVEIGFHIAQRFNCSLQIINSKKLGAPNNPELAIGAVSQNGIVWLDHDLIDSLNISKLYIENETKKQLFELSSRDDIYKKFNFNENISNRDVIVVDDGIATGCTMKSSIFLLKKYNPNNIIIATPIIAYDTKIEFDKLVDDIISLDVSSNMSSIGSFYEDFSQVTHENVIIMLEKSLKN
jgi:predicted phosphoribosyltransferase|tara:strand:- start:2191 stop:2823 length:633 start_codon:yes stop_codon:yes gene_type:complete